MAETVIKESADLDDILAQLPIELRGDAMKKAVGAGARIPKNKARELAPRGNPEHNPDAKPLWKTIGMIVKSYNLGAIWVAIVGPERPAGSHGHLVEDGHEVKVSRGSRKGQAPLTGSARVKGKKFMAPAVDTTMDQQDRAIRASLVESIKKVGG